jgi:serine/threonine protein phosphatase PrpC
MPRIAEDESLEEDVHHVHALRDPVCSSNESSRLPCDVDTCEVYLDQDDLLLLTSPRFWQALTQPEVEAILRGAADARAGAKALARKAASRAEGQDFGIIVVRPLEGWMPSFGIAAAHAGLL